MIKSEKISKNFGEKTVLDNVSIELETGKSYAIIGKSGAGKTTLLNILGGIESPSQGAIIIDDQKLTDKNIAKFRREKFGFIFQNFGLIDTDSVEQNLVVGLKNTRAKNSQELMKSVLKQVGLGYISLKQKVYSLSGGEQQRIALARIILKKPKIVFADEPTGSLDPENSKNILHHLLNDFGDDATIIIATHDANVWNSCDNIIKISDQKLELIKNK